jgi:hypothetical protein
VRRASALAGDLALFLRRHRSESTTFFAHCVHGVLLVSRNPVSGPIGRGHRFRSPATGFKADASPAEDRRCVKCVRIGDLPSTVDGSQRLPLMWITTVEVESREVSIRTATEFNSVYDWTHGRMRSPIQSTSGRQ